MSAAIRIVLVDTSHPGNIGASARAMKNMGLESLVLVRPGSHPDPEAAARAVRRGRRARARARRRGRWTRRSATAASCSARPRGRGARAGASSTRARAPPRSWRRPPARPVAVLFGGERNGLANEELERCEALIRIPVARGLRVAEPRAGRADRLLRGTHARSTASASGRGGCRRCRRPPTSGVRSMRTSSA